MHNSQSPNVVKRQKAIALIITLLVIVVVTIIVTAFMQSMSLEKRTSQAYLNILRAQASVDAAVESVSQKIISQISQPTAGGAAYTTWGYYPDPIAGATYYSAITIGHPTDLTPTPAKPWLSTSNTIWLFSDSTAFNDIANINIPTIQLADPDKISTAPYANLNINGRFKDLPAVVNVPWQEVKRIQNGNNIEIYRFAYWVDDESSRINTATAGNIAGAGNTHLHDMGVKTDEVQPFNVTGSELTALTSSRNLFLTPGSFRQVAQTTAPSSAFDFLTTAFSTGMDVIQYAPAVGPTPISNYPYRGMNKMNLNYEGHIKTTVVVDTRVNRISDWIERGAPSYFTNGVSNYFGSSASSGSTGTLNAAIRRDMIKTISASIIDYVDTDMYPTQPSTLPDPNNMTVPPPPVELMKAVPRPPYFGADGCPRINEIQVIYNSSGAPDGYAANPTANRSGVAGSYKWSIPVTRRIEVWNMTDKTIPAADYKLRMYNQEVIRASAFGFGGDPIPNSTEEVLDLGMLTFSPNEIKAIDVTKTYTSQGPNPLSTIWDTFVKGPDGLTGTSTTNNDDEPNGVSKRACVLFTTASPAWLSATTYMEGNTFATSSPKGNVSSGIGNRGGSQGNRINDPRLSPLRFYTDGVGASVNASDFERDAGSNRPGTIGSINNGAVSSGTFDYQNLDFWYDRPQINATNPKNAEAVTTVSNSRFRSVGEMGNIFDPSWVHPRGRGSDANDGASGNFYAYRKGPNSGSLGLQSLFRGGANLRIGSPDGPTRYYSSSTPLAWDSNSWILLDLFATSSDIAYDSQLTLPPQWFGKVNINFPKSITQGTNTFTNLDLLFHIPNFIFQPPSGVGANFLTSALYTAIRDKRLAKNGVDGIDGVGGIIDNWTECRPFYSTGELSELPLWLDKALYTPAETESKTPTGGSPNASQQLVRVNRSDRGRKEIYNRSANIITTNSNSYRIYIIGQYCRSAVSNPSNVKVLATVPMELSMRYQPLFNSTTGALQGVSAKQIYSIQP